MQTERGTMRTALWAHGLMGAPVAGEDGGRSQPGGAKGGGRVGPGLALPGCDKPPELGGLQPNALHG
jgi:hypothetical protein